MGKRMLCMVLVLSMLCGAVGIKAKAVVDYSFGTEYDFLYTEKDGYLYEVFTNSEITGGEIKLTGENAQKIKSIGKLGVNNEDSFFYGNLRSAVTLDLTECTNLETINDFVGFGKTKRITIKAPTSLKRVGQNVLSSGEINNGKIETTNINLLCESDSQIIECNKLCSKVIFNVNCDSYVGLKKDTEYWENKTWNVFADADDLTQFSSQSKLEKVPERDFHTFDGFYYGDKKIFDKDGNQVDALSCAGKATLDAHWIKGKINATLKNSLNNAVSSKQLTYGDSISSISVPDWEGRRYTFTNWKLDSSVLSFPFTPHDNLTLTAEFSDNVYNVKFMGETETEVKDIVHTHNKYNGDTVDGDIVDFANYPNNKKGYKLEGWGKTKNTVDYTPTDKKKDLTDIGKTLKLYPKMSPISYNVKFWSDDKLYKTDSVKYDEIYYFNNVNPIKVGYELKGWTTKRNSVKPDETATVSNKEKKIYNASDMEDATVNLYAVWELKQYNIDYKNIEGCNFNGIPYYTYNSTMLLPKPSKDGYTFEGWYRDKSFISKIDDTSGCSEDLTVYAKWKPINYCVIFDSDIIVSAEDNNHNTLYDNGNKNKEYEYNAQITEIKIKLVDGSECTGYSILNGNGKVLKSESNVVAKDNVVTIKYKLAITSQIKIKVEGKKAQYKIMYDLDGGKINSDYAKIYTYGDQISLPTNVEKYGCTFVGWLFPNNAIATSIPKDTIGDITVKAIFAEGTYTAFIDLIGGKTNDSSFVDGQKKIEFTYNSGSIVLPTDITKEGATFVGWYDAMAKTYIKEIDTSVPINHSIYAKYSYNTSVGDESELITGDGEEKLLTLSDNLNPKVGDKIVGRYYFAKLSPIEKRIYNTLYEEYEFDMNVGSVNFSDVRIRTKEKFTREEVLNACAALTREHPEIFWIRFFVASDTVKNGNYYESAIEPRLAYAKEIIVANALEYKGNWDNFIHEVKEFSVKDKRDYEKVAFVNKYICTHFSYRNTSNILSASTSNETRSVGYMLCMKEGCCESYAKVAMLMLRELGVEAIYVTSTDHAWNLVLINNQWYTLDVTWNDDEQDNSISGDYLLTAQPKDTHHEIENYSYLTFGFDDNGEVTFKPITTYGNFNAPVVSSKKFGQLTKSNIKYVLKGKNAVVEKVTKKKSTYTIEKKVTISGYKENIKQISENAFKNTKAKKIVIKADITKIGKNAFKGIYKKAKIIVKSSQKKKVIKLIKKKSTGWIKTMKIS